MRTPMRIGLSAAALTLASLAAQAKPAPKQPPAAAPSAERFGVPTSFRGASEGRGYSARDRHMADCLATYPGYNPKTDRVIVAPGVTRRCGL
ncbi:MAG: hypothetical protein JWP86_1154 [Phenylobacterium sp.]|nr:hypothetical protein [Phenylobacterium sp.]MDB5493817.1 hypothetical protein [Phenylobacterium sp.]